MNQPHEWLTQPGGIAEQLARLREAAGLTGKTLAETLGWAPSKVSRIEKGNQTPSAADIDGWARVCNASADDKQELLELLEEVQAAHRDWRRRLRLGQAAVQAGYNELVRKSSVVRHFETVFVPGPLQTHDYARAVLAWSARWNRSTIDDLEEAVAARLLRGQWLYDPSKRFEFLIAEPVLRWRHCSPEAMREQLDRLQSVVDVPGVRFGIIPFNMDLKTPPYNAFVMYDDLVLVETFDEEREHRPNKKSAARYAEAMDLLWDEAVTDTEARRLIAEATNALPH